MASHSKVHTRTALKIFTALLSVVLLSGQSALSAEVEISATASFSYTPNVYGSLSELISDVNNTRQRAFSECISAGINTCQYVELTGSEPNLVYGNKFYNGHPISYIISGTTNVRSRYPNGDVTESSYPAGDTAAGVTHHCPEGFHRRSTNDGDSNTIVTCFKPELVSDHGTCPMPSTITGNPIDFATGEKTEHVVDYQSADGLLRVERRYINQYQGWVNERPLALRGEGVTTLLSGHECTDPYQSIYRRYSEDLPPYINESYPYEKCSSIAGGENTVHLWSGRQRYRYESTDGQDYTATGPRAYTTQLQRLAVPLDDGSAWVYRDQQDNMSFFNTHGQLIRTDLIDGGSLVYSYSADGLLQHKTDHFGRSLTYHYDAEQRLIQVTLPDAQTVTYIWNNRLLDTVIWPDGGSMRYTYNEAAYLHSSARSQQALTGKFDAYDTRIGTYHYNQQSQATYTSRADGVQARTITYGYNNTTETDSRDIAWLHYFTRLSDQTLLLRQTNQPAGSGSAASRDFRNYDNVGRVNEARDFNQHKTQYVYEDTRSLETVKVEGIPNTDYRNYRADNVALQPGITKTQSRWHTQWRSPTQQSEPELITHWVYHGDADPFNNDAIASCAPVNNPRPWICKIVYQATLDPNGSQGFSAALDNTTTERLRQYTYNQYGQKLSIAATPNINHPTTFTYYGSTTSDWTTGDLRTVTNSLGHTTEITHYNRNGYATRIVDANGIVTTLGYDERNRLTTQSFAGVTTTHTYDLNGNRTHSTLPNGETVTYTYDNAYRLIQLSDSVGNTIDYTWDTENNLTEESIHSPDGSVSYTRSHAYDALRQLMTTTRGDNHSDTYRYDAQGNFTGMTDALNQVTSQSYDSQHRLQQTTDALNGSITYQYDGQHRITTVTDQRNNSTTYTYNAFDDLVTQQSPDTGLTTFTYDNGGNRTSKTDARGQRTTYQYDVLNRLTHIDYANHPQENVTYQYDDNTNNNLGVGQLTHITDESGRTTYTYGPFGVTQKQFCIDDTDCYTTAYVYNAIGQLAQMTYPSGHNIHYTYDHLNRVRSIYMTAAGQSSTQIIVSDIQYHPFAGINRMTYGNGVTTLIGQSLAGRMSNIRVNTTAGTTLYQRSYTHNPISNITAITDNDNQNQNNQYTYDALSRLTEAAIGNTLTTYDYDPVGNRTFKQLSENSVVANDETYTTDANGNRLSNISEAVHGASRQLVYDANGNPLQDSGNSDTYSYTYNAANRLSSVTSNSQTTTYTYNALGQRTHKANSNNQAVIYQYGSNGELMSEHPQQAIAPQKDYVYLNQQPIAVIETHNGTATLYHITNDHLGTPQLITDTQQNAVWQAYFTSFGEATVTTEIVKNNLRFPGQYFDEETELHYNWHRYYDPSLGRYLRSDPIGLNGGINTYGYVYQNPLMYSDPDGLRPVARPPNPWNAFQQAHAGQGLSPAQLRQIYRQQQLNTLGGPRNPSLHHMLDNLPDVVQDAVSTVPKCNNGSCYIEVRVCECFNSDPGSPKDFCPIRADHQVSSPHIDPSCFCHIERRPVGG